ncbi:cell wall hydrolase [Terricaulis sp.]|uniref:cell wall hydrolase n=1 Tax=Terricaulis sp. TaxID=2768686 RepID=UPI003784A8FF
MVEIERNPLAVRQGAATIVCIAAAAVAMPVISYRAAEQREGAEWAARSTAFQAELEQQLIQGGSETARVELTSYHGGDGLRARGRATLFESADARATLLETVLRGPMATAEPAPAAEPQINPREHNCLSQAIYYEARGESYRGQVAVAEVIMNRVRSPAYPKSVCAVVYQGSHRATGCQFTFTCDGSLNRRPRGRAWTEAQHVATQVMMGYTRPMTQRATHYHTNAVNPVWSSGLVETTTIGSHVFYRFPTASERPIYQQALARRMGSRRQPEALIPEAEEGEEQATQAAESEGQEAGVTTPAPAAADAPVTTGATDIAT